MKKKSTLVKTRRKDSAVHDGLPSRHSSWIWIYFHIFLLINLFLAYLPCPSFLKWGLGLPALAVAWGLLLKNFSLLRPSKAPDGSKEWFSFPSTAVLGLLLLSACPRFAFLTSFFAHPLFDEAANSFFAFHLNLHWTWHPFFYFSQMPPLYIWMLAGLFKIGGVSLFSLWFLPALISWLCVPLSYAACRTLFPRSFSLICAFLVALSFWPLWLGRLSHQMGLMVLWEWLCLWLLGKFLSAPPSSSRKWAFGLGLGIGGGFYVYFAWPIVAVFVAAVVFIDSWQRKRGSSALGFLGCVLVAVLPLLISSLASQGGGFYYYLHRWRWNSDLTDNGWDVFHSLYYLTTLFWEGWKGYFSFAPQWGGLLNPVLGAFFFLGFAQCCRFFHQSFFQALLGALFLFFFPVLFTNNFSASRLVPLLPPCLIVVVLGVQTLGSLEASGWKKIYFPSLLAFSILLDGFNMVQTGAYSNAWEQSPRYKWLVLTEDRLSSLGKTGAGAAFLNFIQDTGDRSLSFLTYPFNAVVNPQVPADSISWAAVLTDEEYLPCLSRCFPSTQWQFLDWDVRDMKGGIYFVRGIYLGIIPLSPSNRRAVLRWVRMGRDIEDLVLAELNYVPHSPHDRILQEMTEFYDDFKAEDFPRSYFWEKVAEYHLKDGHDTPALEAMENALQTDCDRGYLYQEKGQLLVRMKKYAEASRAFQKAGRLDKRFTAPPEIFKLLDRLQKQAR